MASYQAVIGGHWLTELARWGELETIHGWPGDCLEASWEMTTRYRAHHPVFHRDARCSVSFGGFPIFGGLLQEPEWNGREAKITVRGWWRAGEDYPAFTTEALATDNPALAIASQQVRGLPWILTPSVPNDPMLDGSPERANTISALMDAYAEAAEQGWGVDARGRVYMAGSTSHLTSWSTDGVDYHVRGGAGAMSTNADTFASHVGLWYLNQDNVYKSVVYPIYLASGEHGNAYEKRWGHRDWTRDITDLGPIHDNDALAVAQAIYIGGKLRPSFTQGLELFPGELLTHGGVRASFNRVKPNKVVRVHGVRDEVLHTPYTDFVIGKVTRRSRQRSILIDPVGVSSSTQDELYQELLERAAGNGADA